MYLWYFMSYFAVKSLINISHICFLKNLNSSVFVFGTMVYMLIYLFHISNHTSNWFINNVSDWVLKTRVSPYGDSKDFLLGHNPSIRICDTLILLQCGWILKKILSKRSQTKESYNSIYMILRIDKFIERK